MGWETISAVETGFVLCVDAVVMALVLPLCGVSALCAARMRVILGAVDPGSDCKVHPSPQRRNLMS